MSSGVTPSGLTQTVPTTILQAVNQMLKAIGRAEVMALKTENMNEDSQSALSMLSDTNVEVQSRGWHMNTDEGFPISPDADGYINVPNDAVSVTINPQSFPADITQRGQRMYDRANHTFVFTKPVFVDLVTVLPFEECTQPMRWYVMAKAGRRYGVGRLPDSATFRFTKDVEDEAWAALLQHDQDSRKATLPESSPHFASFRRGQRRILP